MKAEAWIFFPDCLYCMPRAMHQLLTSKRAAGVSIKWETTIFTKTDTMGLLTPKGKKGDKKNNQKAPQGGLSGAKPLNKQIKSSGFGKKQMPGSANRGS